MSRENLEVARRLYPGRIDVAATFADPKALGAVRAAYEPLVHPDFESVPDPHAQTMLRDPGMNVPPGPPQSISYGIDGLARSFGEWLSAWESWVVTPIDFIEVDENRVLAVIEIDARSKTHGAEMTIQGGNLLTLRDGKVARLELFLRKADALEAAGLSPASS